LRGDLRHFSHIIHSEHGCQARQRRADKVGSGRELVYEQNCALHRHHRSRHETACESVNADLIAAYGSLDVARPEFTRPTSDALSDRTATPTWAPAKSTDRPVSMRAKPALWNIGSHLSLHLQAIRHALPGF
jgi:hypothetical protein